MKSLLILAALVGVAGADPRTYDVRATARDNSGDFSCGATSRMMRDKHIIRIDDENGTVAVDGFSWEPWDEVGWMPNLTISFHTSSHRVSQKTYLVMDLHVSAHALSGTYILYGRTPKGDECSDAVHIEGRRL